MAYRLHTDGGARGNPGPAAVGIVLEDESGGIVKKYGEFLGHATNNEAEYRAVILGLETALAEGVRDLECFLDSQLVASQLAGLYKVKDARMREFWKRAKDLEEKIGKVTYTHVRRHENSHADDLVNEVLDEKAGEI